MTEGDPDPRFDHVWRGLFVLAQCAALIAALLLLEGRADARAINAAPRAAPARAIATQPECVTSATGATSGLREPVGEPSPELERALGPCPNWHGA